jgi:hypothetical protein
MLEGNGAGTIERDQEVIEVPVVQEQRLRNVVTAKERAAPAANEASVRAPRRPRRAIVWDDGGLKPFRLA